jgi:hypothetical protein
MMYMKKRLIPFMLLLCMICLAGCGNGAAEPSAAPHSGAPGSGAVPSVSADPTQPDTLLAEDGNYTDETAGSNLEQTEMPPYGSHWDVQDMFGTWRMISFADYPNGTVTSGNGIFNIFDSDTYVYSELAVYTTLLADYRLELGEGDFGETAQELSMRRVSGALWEGCGNDAWYVELTGNGADDDMILYATYADDRLLLKKNKGAGADSFFESFTAVYERLAIDQQYDWHEWEEWIGDYDFYEYAPPDHNMVYSISIGEHPEWPLLTAHIEIDGFQTEVKQQARVVGNANYIEIVYSSYLSGLRYADFAGVPFREGEIMLTLTRDGDDIYTAWGALKPMLPANGAPAIYFEKSGN